MAEKPIDLEKLFEKLRSDCEAIFGQRLEGEVLKEARRTYDLTARYYIDCHRRKPKAPTDHWANEKFRKFINRQVKRIGENLETLADGKKPSKQQFMDAVGKAFEDAKKDAECGEFEKCEDSPPPVVGEVCTRYYEKREVGWPG